MCPGYYCNGKDIVQKLSPNCLNFYHFKFVDNNIYACSISIKLWFQFHIYIDAENATTLVGHFYPSSLLTLCFRSLSRSLSVCNTLSPVPIAAQTHLGVYHFRKFTTATSPKLELHHSQPLCPPPHLNFHQLRSQPLPCSLSLSLQVTVYSKFIIKKEYLKPLINPCFSTVLV